MSSLSAAGAILFSDNAAQKVWGLIQEEGDLDLALRVYITGGGCSGFQYGFSFEETVAEDDWIITKSLGEHSVRLAVDAMSFQYLQGAEIDYQEDIHGGQFIIRNPNAKTTCGCGSSFSMD